MSYKSHSSGQSCRAGTEEEREAMHKEKEFEAEMTKSTPMHLEPVRKEMDKLGRSGNPSQNTFTSKSPVSLLKTVNTEKNKAHWKTAVKEIRL